MKYHYSVTYGRQCGIATFTENIKSDDYEITNIVPQEADELLIEMEYGIFHLINWQQISKLKTDGCKIKIIMHSVNDNPINAEIRKYADVIIVLNPLALSIFPEAMYIPHPSESFHNKKEWQFENNVIHHGFLLPKNNTELLVKSNLGINKPLHLFTPVNNFSLYAYQHGIKIYHKLSMIHDHNIFTLDMNFYSKKELSEKMSNINGVIILPQDDESDIHASGAVYMSLSTGNPVIVSQSKQFNDLPMLPKIKPDSQGISYSLRNMKSIIKDYDFKAVEKVLKDRKPEKFIEKIRGL